MEPPHLRDETPRDKNERTYICRQHHTECTLQQQQSTSIRATSYTQAPGQRYRFHRLLEVICAILGETTAGGSRLFRCDRREKEQIGRISPIGCSRNEKRSCLQVTNYVWMRSVRETTSWRSRSAGKRLEFFLSISAHSDVMPKAKASGVQKEVATRWCTLTSRLPRALGQ